MKTSLCMCDLCFPDGEEVGLIAAGFALIRNGEAYSLLHGDGHGDSVLYTFKEKPVPDPDPEGVTDDETTTRWCEAMSDLMDSLRLCAQDGYELVKKCREAGFEESKCHFCYWLLNRCGELLEIKEGKRPAPPPPSVPAGSWNFRVMVKNTQSPVTVENVCPASKCFGVHEVHYDAEGTPDGWSNATVVSETLEGLKWTLQEMNKALDKPVLTDTAA